MRNVLLPFILLFSFAACFAQAPKAVDNVVDSLLHNVDLPQADSNRMKTYERLGDHYSDNNADKAIEFYEKAKDIALRENFLLRAANNYYSIGFFYLIKAEQDKSLYNYQQSTLLYEKLGDKRRLSNAYMSIGNVYFQGNDRIKTDIYYDKAEALIKTMDNPQQLSYMYDTRGNVYDQLGSYDKALEYYQKSLVIDKKEGLEDSYYSTLSNLALSYKHQFKTDLAIKYFDSVRVYFEKMKMPPDQMAALYNNIGATYAQAKKYPDAITSFNKSIAIGDSIGNSAVVMENYRNMADMYGDMKNYQLEADYLKKYHGFKDSLFSADSKNKLTELEANYIVEKKNTELIKKDAEVAKQKNRQKVLIIIAFSILALFVGLILFYTRIQKKNKLLQEKNVQINEQKDELQTLNHVKDRLFSIISHDLRNPLVTLRSYLMLADNDAVAPEKKQQFKLQTMNAVSQTGDMLDNLLAWANVQIKNTKTNIIPVNVGDLIADAENNVKAQAMQKEISITQDLQAEVLPGDYDILNIALRNLLTNAIKYSPAKSSINLSAVPANGNVLLSVQDEGIGLTKEQINAVLSKQNTSTAGTHGEKGSGLGLFLVQELLQKINATLSIESKEGDGSKFIISVPAF